jgi:hypothetical protein
MRDTVANTQRKDSNVTIGLLNLLIDVFEEFLLGPDIAISE